MSNNFKKHEFRDYDLMKEQEALDAEIAVVFEHVERLDESRAFAGWSESLETITDAVWCDMQATGQPLAAYTAAEIAALFGRA